MAKYDFTHTVTNDENFIKRYIDYASALNDSPWDYHEAVALMLLSCATQGLKLYLPKMPGGLRTNLYIILFGDSFKMRKSVALSRGELFLNEALPGTALPTSFTLEGLQNALAEREDMPSVILSDEFSYHLGRMMRLQYMEGLRGFFLQMYNRPHWLYRRSDKGGKNKEQDIVEIRDAHLSIIGNVTPDILHDLSERDMRDGFLGRFIIIAPDGKPPRDPLYARQEEDEGARAIMIQFLKDLNLFSSRMKRAEKNSQERGGSFSAVHMSLEALKVIDFFQEEIECKRYDDTSVGTMIWRLTDYALKTSILIAAGETNTRVAAQIVVEEEHAQQAVTLAKKWMRWAEHFGSNVGHNPIEGRIRKVIDFIQSRGIVPRTEACRLLHLTRREADDIQNTLLDRNLLLLGWVKLEGSRKKTMVWRWHDYDIPLEHGENGSEPPEGVTVEPAPEESVGEIVEA